MGDGAPRAGLLIPEVLLVPNVIPPVEAEPPPNWNKGAAGDAVEFIGWVEAPKVKDATPGKAGAAAAVAFDA